MKRKLFKNLNESFFNPLSSPNKDIYVDCLFILYDVLDSVEASFQAERELIIQILMQYFEDRDPEVNNDLLEFEECTTPRKKAVAVINYFKECGWIGEEELGDYKTSINLFDYTIMIAEVLLSIATGEQLEYSGEIFAVFTLLKNFSIDEGVGILEQAVLQTKKITRRLKALKANIYRYYFDILNTRKDQPLNDILDTLLNEYKVNFFDKSYYNLKTKDSLPRYKNVIIKLINSIHDDELQMTQLSEQLMRLKDIAEYDIAYHQIEENLREIKDSFNAFDNLIREIDIKNEQYITAAASRILFLTKRSDDLEGIFNRIFDILLKSNEKEFDYNSLFNLCGTRNLDDESLRKPRIYREEIEAETLLFDDSIIDENIKREKIRLMMKNNAYGQGEINKYALGLLGDNDEIDAKDISLETEEDLIKLVLIYLYSRSPNAKYTCETLDTDVRNNFVTFNDFLIKIRRKRK